MNERLLTPSENEPVTIEEIQEQLRDFSRRLKAELVERAVEKNYHEPHLQMTLDYLTGKTEVLAEGLLPVADYTELSKLITELYSMAETSAMYANRLETTNKIIAHVVETLQTTILEAGMLSDEAQAELRERWPADGPQLA